jgi:hypothetical protein
LFSPVSKISERFEIDVLICVVVNSVARTGVEQSWV